MQRKSIHIHSKFKGAERGTRIWHIYPRGNYNLFSEVAMWFSKETASFNALTAE